MRQKATSTGRGVVREVDFDARVLVERMGWLKLQGLDAPVGDADRKRLRERLRELALGREIAITSEGSDPKGFEVVLATIGDRSLSETVLDEGLAWFRTQTRESSEQARLVAASRRAKGVRRGLWQAANAVDGLAPLQRGAVLGLYFKVDRPYHEQIDRVVASGADWIQLLLTVFVDSVDSNEIVFDRRRTVSNDRLRETIRYARKKGLRVALLPIVLIRGEVADDDWRGTLRPTDPGRFWSSYDAFLCRYLDISRDEGVELVYVGSELCSLESSHEAWRRVIANARGRYAGWLGYSANWDHYDVPKFWPLVDQVGLTAYFELTDDVDASLPALETAWRTRRTELAEVSAKLRRPLVFTELGYASQDGVNTAPWNYYLTDKIDLDEQADCYRAFYRVMRDAPFLRGVYIFDFFERGGTDDKTYAVWGKPAFHVVKRILADFGKNR